MFVDLTRLQERRAESTEDGLLLGDFVHRLSGQEAGAERALLSLSWWHSAPIFVKTELLRPQDPGGPAIIEAAELSLILEGITLAGARKRPRWEPIEGQGP